MSPFCSSTEAPTGRIAVPIDSSEVSASQITEFFGGREVFVGSGEGRLLDPKALGGGSDIDRMRWYFVRLG